MIHLTKDAIKYFNNQKKVKTFSHIRFGCKSGGCSGFEYVIIFEGGEAKDNDTIFYSEDIKIVVDPKSLKLIDGTTIGRDNSLIRSGFIFNNPNGGSTCGCGNSFNTIDK